MKSTKHTIMSRSSIFLFFLIAILFVASCKDEDEPRTNGDIELDSTPFALEVGVFPQPDIAADNLLTVQGVKLGRMLFYETMLSKDGSMSCASCHRQEDGFSDTAKFSTGVQGKLGGRQAMAIFNMAWHGNEFFWDGRAHLLRDQSLKPIQDALEMDETLDNVIAKLSASQAYKDQFKRTFGSEEITSEKMSKAMEQFMNSIVSNKSKYDKVLAGLDSFTPAEKRGRDLFFAEYNEFFPDESGADCAHCHSGFNFENDLYMNNGLDEESKITDEGRSAVTKDMKDKGKFKVPSMRNIELTPPYMHDGRFKTLKEVVNHYNSGIQLSPSLDPAIRNTQKTGLFLDEKDKDDLVAFLKTLTDKELGTNPAHSSPF